MVSQGQNDEVVLKFYKKKKCKKGEKCKTALMGP